MADKKKNREMVARRGVKCMNVDNSSVDIQSFMKSTPARVLKDNPSYFSNEAQVELTEKRSKVKDKFSSCCCTGADDSAWNSQLGTASSLEELRSTFVKRLGVSGDTLQYILIQLAVPVQIL